jgi:hypothetical protein
VLAPELGKGLIEWNAFAALVLRLGSLNRGPRFIVELFVVFAFHRIERHLWVNWEVHDAQHISTAHDYPRRYSNGSGARRHVVKDHRISPDLRMVADRDGAQDFRAGADIHVPAQYRSARLAAAAGA